MGFKIELKCGLEALHEHITLLKVSGRPLGALLEALGAEKMLLIALGGLLSDFSSILRPPT